MGGAQGGKTASTLAVNSIIDRVKNTDLTNPSDILTDAIKYANRVIYSKAQSNSELMGMGTTAVVLLINRDKATAAHAGDSRIYQMRGRNKVFRTFDHSEVFEYVKMGTLSEEQARLSAKSNVILRALGVKPDIEVEIEETLPYFKGDRFILCSDGISGSMPENKLLRLFAAKKTAQEAAENLAEVVDNIGISKGGGHDNLTAAVIELKVNSKIEPKMSKLAKRIILTLSFLLIAALAGLCYITATYYNAPDNAGTNPKQQSEAKYNPDSLIKQIGKTIDTNATDSLKLDGIKQVVNDYINSTKK
jgi:serine/threonine protein phosphatase PrpC